jgi:hypothetical protein
MKRRKLQGKETKKKGRLKIRKNNMQEKRK